MNSYCIIGAGITGITLAKDLHDPVILEKSKGVGGRLAARRLGGLSIEHGAQAFLHPTFNRLIPRPHEWIKSEIGDLEIIRSWEASHFESSKNKISVFNTMGEKILCKKLIICIPAPQAKALIENSGIEGNFLSEVKYKSDIQLMFLGSQSCLSNNIKKHFDVITQNSISDHQHIFLLTMKDRFVPSFLEMDKEDIKNEFISEFDENVSEAHVHKWRYSEVIHSISSFHQLSLKENNVFLAGDYFSTSGILGSMNSAKLLADYFEI